MWRKKEQRPKRAVEPTGASGSLVDESVAFLSGRYAEYLMTHTLPIPAWAWLNGIAHGDIDDIQALAAGRATGPSVVIADLAAQIVTLVTTQRLMLTSIQNRILIPLELHLVDKPGSLCPRSAAEMAQILRDAMADGVRPLRYETAHQPHPEVRLPRTPFKCRFWEI